MRAMTCEQRSLLSKAASSEHSVSGWQCRPDHGPVRLVSTHLETAPDQVDPLAHTGQSQMATGARRGDAGGGDATAVVGDREQHLLTVTDDGCGIPATSIPSASSGGHLGLTGMRERVNLVGGSLEVCAHKPHGTVVRATLPATHAVLT